MIRSWLESESIKKRVDAGTLFTILLLWCLYLGYPMQHLQNIRWTFLGYAVPFYYFLTVALTAVPAALALLFKRRWTKWELLWWTLPLVCLPGVLNSDDRLWSLRQWFSWVVRGVIPGGIIFLTFSRKKHGPMLLYWIYPVIIAAALLGLAELCTYHNPFWDGFNNHIPPTAQAANPFYRPIDAIVFSDPPLGTQGDRIPYSATLVCFLPLGLWLLKYKRRQYWAHLFAVGALCAILVMAQVRAVWVATLAAVVLMRILGLQRNYRETGRIIAGILLWSIFFLIWPKTHHLLWTRLNTFHLTEKSIQERLAVLQTATVLKDHWLLGVGFGLFPTACKPNSTPDNQYLRWAIENGLAASALLASFFVGLVRASWKRIKLLQDPAASGFYKSMLIGWLSIAVTFLFFDGFYWGACNMTFWSLLGLFATSLRASD
jgi:hypothetical protein